MDWWMYFVIWALGIPIAVLIGYRVQWNEIRGGCDQKMKSGYCRARSYGNPKCRVHSRQEQHPNVWDDAPEILWMPLFWPVMAVLAAIYGITAGGGWAFRTVTMPKEIKQQRLPDLREEDK